MIGPHEVQFPLFYPMTLSLHWQFCLPSCYHFVLPLQLVGAAKQLIIIKMCEYITFFKILLNNAIKLMGGGNALAAILSLTNPHL